VCAQQRNRAKERFMDNDFARDQRLVSAHFNTGARARKRLRYLWAALLFLLILNLIIYFGRKRFTDNDDTAPDAAAAAAAAAGAGSAGGAEAGSSGAGADLAGDSAADF
jgi:hypothetical protein